MRKMEIMIWALPVALTLSGCGDLTVNQPAKPSIIIEEKKDRPLIIEKTTVEKPVIIENKREEKPIITIEKH